MLGNKQNDAKHETRKGLKVTEITIQKKSACADFWLFGRLNRNLFQEERGVFLLGQ